MSRLVGIALFVGLAVVYWVAPYRDLADSRYTLLLSESLRRHGSAELTRYFPPLPLAPGRFPGVPAFPSEPPRRTGYPYQLDFLGERIFLHYPPGTALLSLPLAFGLDALGISAVRQGGGYDARGEERAQAILAALLTAATSVVLFRTARRRLPLGWSLGVALAAGLGTSLLSTASRALWTHTWSTLLLALAVDELVRADDARAPPRGSWLATLLAWSFFVRPTNAVSVAAVFGFLLLRDRRSALRFAVAGGFWLAAFLAFNAATRGEWLPVYYEGRRLSWLPGLEALAVNLVSPSRGLLFFSPLALFGAALLVRYRATAAGGALLVLAGTVIGLHQLVLATAPEWHAGHSYGARYWTDMVPWLALIGVAGLCAARDAARFRGSPLLPAPLRFCAVALLVWGAAAQLAGVTSSAGYRWNDSPRMIELARERVWDWRDPQFLALWTRRNP